MTTVFTIGHSNHDPEAFIALLRSARIEVVVDVRSNPDGAWAEFARKGNIATLLKSSGIKYLYMGDSLGGRPPDAEQTSSGKVDYEALARRDSFKKAITSVVNGATQYRICIMCSEESPAHCHRSLLVGNALARAGLEVRHIRGDQSIQSDAEIAKERAGVAVAQQMLPL